MSRQYRQLENTGGHQPTTLAVELAAAGCKTRGGDMMIPAHKFEQTISGAAEAINNAMMRHEANVARRRNVR